ncbi:SDR family NAD(P)-dependent oxidoreductase [Streptomyces sp. NPDC047841]|uniref:SDR family NAD(P)-dependent oxidoreductase n=1 Tax=Streptomyces sp. NPDC047841 TaxID=3154708 RepID=UPI0034548905
MSPPSTRIVAPLTSPDECRATCNVNVVSGVRMIQHLVPAMRERGWGRVVTIGGGLASQPMNTHPRHNAALAARHNRAVSLARELKGTGVTSNVVSPGAILVEATRELVTGIGPARGRGRTWEEIRPAPSRHSSPTTRNGSASRTRSRRRWRTCAAPTRSTSAGFYRHLSWARQIEVHACSPAPRTPCVTAGDVCHRHKSIQL